MTDLKEAARLALSAMEYADACLKKQLTTKTKHEYAQDLLLEAAIALRAALEQPAHQPIRCEHRLKNNGVCPHHNLHCGWPKCNEPKQPAQDEPVVWMYQDKSTHAVSFQKTMRSFVDHGAIYETPLYTLPQAREPLTDDEIDVLIMDSDGLPKSHLEFARDIEAAHGIGEKK